MSSQKEVGAEADTHGMASRSLRPANTVQEETGRLGPRREGSAFPGEVGKAASRRS